MTNVAVFSHQNEQVNHWRFCFISITTNSKEMAQRSYLFKRTSAYKVLNVHAFLAML